MKERKREGGKIYISDYVQYDFICLFPMLGQLTTHTTHHTHLSMGLASSASSFFLPSFDHNLCLGVLLVSDNPPFFFPFIFFLPKN